MQEQLVFLNTGQIFPRENQGMLLANTRGLAIVDIYVKVQLI